MLVKDYTENEDIIITVSNYSISMPAQLIPLQFQPSTRSEAGQRGEGLGLGLYMASQITSAYNGTSHVISTPEFRTCFAARFPAQFKWA
ncbi:MAG: ATP-binding protein [Pseudomonas fluorescens]